MPAPRLPIAAVVVAATLCATPAAAGAAPRHPRRHHHHHAPAVNANVTRGGVTVFERGIVTDTRHGNLVQDITAGPLNSVWAMVTQAHPDLTQPHTVELVRLSLTGQATPVAAISIDGGQLSFHAGPDGNLWAGETGGNDVQRITPAGQVTRVALPTGVDPAKVLATSAGIVVWECSLRPDHCDYSIAFLDPSTLQLTQQSLPSDITATEDGPPSVNPDGTIWWPEASDRGYWEILYGPAADQQRPFSTWPFRPKPTGLARTHDLGNGEWELRTTPWLDAADPGGSTLLHVTPAGTQERFAAPFTAPPLQFQQAPDASFWAIDHNTTQVTHVSSQGRLLATYAIPNTRACTLTWGKCEARHVVIGPNGRPWFLVMGGVATVR